MAEKKIKERLEIKKLEPESWKKVDLCLKLIEIKMFIDISINLFFKVYKTFQMPSTLVRVFEIVAHFSTV